MTNAPPELIRQVPGCESGESPLAVAALPGGRGLNRVWRVTTRCGEFVLRLRREPINRPGAKASFEMQSHRLAAANGLTPPIAAAAADGRWMVMDFVRAPSWSETQLLSKAGIDALGSVLRRVHELEASTLSQADVLQVATEYVEALQKVHTQDTDTVALEFAAIRADCQQLSKISRRAVLNHGDLMVSNLLGDVPVLVDWEYARRADPTWDIACLLEYYPKIESQLDRLLAVCGLATTQDRQILSLQRRLFSRLNCLWQKLQVGN